MSAISPKVWIPTALAAIAGIALWLITGDKSALIIVLTGLATGGAGAVAPHAPGVHHSDVVRLSRERTRSRR